MPWTNEPPYPASAEGLDIYCHALVGALLDALDDRLRCVLLFGSWSRGEATPPRSDVDLMVVIDSVDDDVLNILRQTWITSQLGTSNVFGLDEIPYLARDAIVTLTDEATVLYGTNPFTAPTRAEQRIEIARIAESLLRTGRSLLLYPWLTDQERSGQLSWARGKTNARWGLRLIAALHTGHYVRTWVEVCATLDDTPYAPILAWLDQDIVNADDAAARQLLRIARLMIDDIAG